MLEPDPTWRLTVFQPVESLKEADYSVLSFLASVVLYLLARWIEIKEKESEEVASRAYLFGTCIASEDAVWLCGEKRNVTYGSLSQSHLL